MWAIIYGNLELIQAVFSRKDIDFEVRDNQNNETVLDHAINMDDQERISIVQGAKEAAKMKTAASATEVEMPVENMMYDAINNENKGAILNLIQHPDLNINFPVNGNNLTFPMWAIMMGNLEFIQAVFSREDIDFEVRDTGNDWMVLDYARGSNNADIWKIVMKATAIEATMEATMEATAIEATMKATMEATAIEAIMKNAREQEDGPLKPYPLSVKERLYLAIRKGDIDRIKKLVKYNADLDMNAQGKGGRTFLMWAILTGNPEIVRIVFRYPDSAKLDIFVDPEVAMELVQCKSSIDFDLRDNKGASIWDYAENSNNPEIYEIVKQAAEIEQNREKLKEWAEGQIAKANWAQKMVGIGAAIVAIGYLPFV
jgi:ankyrin repeat protein